MAKAFGFTEKHFYSHIPCGMWRYFFFLLVFPFKFLLTHPVWDVTSQAGIPDVMFIISTHTSRVGCDMGPSEIANRWNHFYSHIPCGMWRPRRGRYRHTHKFLLTHPVWDVTSYKWKLFCYFKFLLTHPVWDVTAFHTSCYRIIVFLLTHPVWDVTGAICLSFRRIYDFYSHIPCGMWRYLFWYRRRRIMNFYSHIPCGMWLRRCYLKYCRDKFLLTHPVWDVTMRMLKLENIIQISTHTSRVGCDSENTARPREWSISTHTSRVGCDVRLCRTLWSEWNFYSHIPCGMWLMERQVM